MIVKQYNIQGPPYLKQGRRENSDYRKVKEEFRSRFWKKYKVQTLCTYPEGFSDNSIFIIKDIGGSFVIVQDARDVDGVANRMAIMVSDNEKNIHSAKSELENMFEGDSKLELIEL